MKCGNCDGNLRKDGGCNLCEIFRDGITQPAVEVERLNKPKLSDAFGVAPHKIEKVMEFERKSGVPTDYAPDGRAIIRSRSHQKNLCKLYGLHNKDGGYGD